MDTKNGQRRVPLTLICSILVSFGFSTGVAKAAVLRCDNCSAETKKIVATNAGVGMHIVADFAQESLVGWRVIYDQERGVTMTRTMAVPQQIRDSFAYTLSPEMANSGATIIVGPDNPNNSFTFPPGFEDADAYDVVQSMNLRTRLQTETARYHAGATTGNPTLDNLAISLNAVALTVTGFGSATIVIEWRNGSKTTLKIEASSAHEATYQDGKSRDPQDFPIPDPAVSNEETGGTYAGDYNFNSPNGLEDWINQAVRNGVTITGGGGGGSQTQMSCSWDGTTLSCVIY